MGRAFLWLRYGFCTGLGLVLIGLAAISGPAEASGVAADAPPDPRPDASR